MAHIIKKGFKRLPLKQCATKGWQFLPGTPARPTVSDPVAGNTWSLIRLPPTVRQRCKHQINDCNRHVIDFQRRVSRDGYSGTSRKKQKTTKMMLHSFCIKQPVSACSPQTENNKVMTRSFCIKQPVSAWSPQTENNKVMTHNFCIKQPVSAWSPENTCEYKFAISSVPLQTLVRRAKRNKLMFAPTLEWIHPYHSPPGPATAASTRMWDWRWPGSRSSRWTSSQAAAPVKQMSEQTNSSLGYTTRRDGYRARPVCGCRSEVMCSYTSRLCVVTDQVVCDFRSKVMCSYTSRLCVITDQDVCVADQK